MNKSELRKRALERRNLVSMSEQEKWSKMIQEKISLSPWYHEADVVLSYAAFRSEVDTEWLNSKIIQDGKRLYLPKTYVKKHYMEIYDLKDLAELEFGYQGIQEPIGDTVAFCDRKETSKKVLMLMPGVAFDCNRNRIGYGGGYYDQYLLEFGELIQRKILLAYDCQKVANIQVEQCDISPDEIITEKEIY